MKKFFLVLMAISLLLITARTALATDWLEIPFSNEGAYLELHTVLVEDGIMSFWFMARKVDNPSDYQKKLDNENKDAWTINGHQFQVSVRKVEVKLETHEVRSTFAAYFDQNGKQVGKEPKASKWAPETGPRLWVDLMYRILAKEGHDTGMPPIAFVFKKIQIAANK